MVAGPDSAAPVSYLVDSNTQLSGSEFDSLRPRTFLPYSFLQIVFSWDISGIGLPLAAFSGVSRPLSHRSNPIGRAGTAAAVGHLSL